MKKVLLSFILLSAIVITSQAQGFRLGVKVGGNLTKITGSSLQEKFELGFQGGAFAEIDINKRFGIQPEVLFSQSKTKTKNAGQTASEYIPDEKANFDYLSIPLLLRINASKYITFLVGPEYSILLNNDNSVFQNGEEAFKSGNFSMIGGLQLNLSSFRVYGRYNIGLSNINDIDNSEKWKQQQLQIGIGLKL